MCREIRLGDLDRSVGEFLSGYSADGTVYDRPAVSMLDLDSQDDMGEAMYVPKAIRRRRKRTPEASTPVERTVFRLVGVSALQKKGN